MSQENRADAARALEEAWSHLSQGQRKTARELATRAAKLDPQAEGPWLVLAAVSTPEESLKYLQKVLEINPANQRALQGIHWAEQRIQTKREILGQKEEPAETDKKLPTSGINSHETDGSPEAGFNALEKDLIAKGYDSEGLDETRPIQINPKPPKKEEPAPQRVVTQGRAPVRKAQAHPAKPKTGPSQAKVVTALLITVALFMVVTTGLAFTFSDLLFPSLVSANSSDGVVRSFPNFSLIAQPTASNQTNEIAQSETEENVAGETLPDTPAPTITYAPTFTDVATRTPISSPTPSETSTPVPTATLPPTVVAVPVDDSDIETADADFTGKWIDVDLANQMVYAYEEDEIVREFVISSGISAHPTVKGQYHIYLKYRYDDMVGPGYNLKDVPYVMYFYKGYGLHGTYWHNNFGTPMSHGCVNMRTDEAEWLYNFAPMGTLVNVH